MIKATLLYPNAEGVTFDFEYWTTSHLPWIKRILSPALQGLGAERTLAGAPDAPAPYVAVGYLHFQTVEALQEAYAPHAAAIAADIKNFTNAEPVMLLSEILLS